MACAGRVQRRQLTCRSLAWKSSGDITRLPAANALIQVPASTAHFPAGTTVNLLKPEMSSSKNSVILSLSKDQPPVILGVGQLILRIFFGSWSFDKLRMTDF